MLYNVTEDIVQSLHSSHKVQSSYCGSSVLPDLAGTPAHPAHKFVFVTISCLEITHSTHSKSCGDCNSPFSRWLHRNYHSNCLGALCFCHSAPCKEPVQIYGVKLLIPPVQQFHFEWLSNIWHSSGLEFQLWQGRPFLFCKGYYHLRKLMKRHQGLCARPHSDLSHKAMFFTGNMEATNCTACKAYLFCSIILTYLG